MRRLSHSKKQGLCTECWIFFEVAIITSKPIHRPAERVIFGRRLGRVPDRFV